MRNKLFSITIGLSILALVSIACGLGAKTDGTPTAPPAKTQVKSDVLGETYISKVGGFSIQKVKGYEFKEVIGIANMYAPGADEKVGPGIMALGGLNDTASTNEELLVKLKGGSSSFTFAKEQKIKVAGQDGLVIDVEGKEGSQSIKGRIALVMASPKQQFTLTGIAPTNRWDEIAPIFDAVLASTTFFQADPSALEPAADTPTEGPSAAEPAPVETVESSAPTKTGPELLPLRQWAISAKASSQYGSIDWAASQATGEPNVPECSDNVKAWASKGTQTVEWIELTYAIPVTPTEINIYQSYNPSQVVEVQMTDTNGKKYSAWTGQPEKVSNCPDLMTISLELTKNILVNKIRITIDQSVFKVGWDEIDSVELVGYAEGQAALP